MRGERLSAGWPWPLFLRRLFSDVLFATSFPDPFPALLVAFVTKLDHEHSSARSVSRDLEKVDEPREPRRSG